MTPSLHLAVTGNLAGSLQREAKDSINLDTEISCCSLEPCLIRFMKPRVGCFQCYDPCREGPFVHSLVNLFLVDFHSPTQEESCQKELCLLASMGLFPGHSLM